MHWTKAAIDALDEQIKRYGLTSDQPLMILVESALKEEDAREVHAADVRVAGAKYGASIRPWRDDSTVAE